MKLAEHVGGVGVAIMTFKTEFERALAEAGDHLATYGRHSDQVRKSAAGLDVRDLQKLATILTAADAAMTRACATFAEWAGHVHPRHVIYECFIADKNFDTINARDGFAAALKAGAIVQMMPKQRAAR